MMEATKPTFRETLAHEFIKCLEEGQENWKKGWNYGGDGYQQKNAITGNKYNGMNMFKLLLSAVSRGYTDSRWCTFKQIQTKGWKLQKGSKATQIEYWQPYNLITKKRETWDEYENAKNQGREKDYKITPMYFSVFNGSCIDGIPKEPPVKKNDINPNEIIKTIVDSMGVTLEHDGRDSAYYSPKNDSIHLPPAHCFSSEYGYHATALHEISHATGHESRLNRNILNTFGTQEYAFEELVAEISACFTSVELQFKQEESHLNNHKAYIQSWIQSIREKPNILIEAIKEAEKTANYIELHAGLVKEKECKQEIDQSQKDTNNENKPKKSLLKELDEKKKQVKQAKSKPMENKKDK